MPYNDINRNYDSCVSRKCLLVLFFILLESFQAKRIREFSLETGTDADSAQVIRVSKVVAATFMMRVMCCKHLVFRYYWTCSK